MFVYKLNYSPFKKLTERQYLKLRESGWPNEYKGDRYDNMNFRPKDVGIMRNLLTFETERIVLDIMYYAGLGTNNNIIIDNDSRKPVPYNQKFMVYPPNSLEIVKSGNAVNFDPIFNFRIMESVFKVYISKVAAERNWDLRSFYIIVSKEGFKQGEVRFNDGSAISSKHYINDTMCYLDLILRIEGMDENTILNIAKSCDEYICNVKMMKGRRV